MWAALRALEDKVELSRCRAEIARQNGLLVLADRFVVEEQAAQQYATALRALLRLGGRPGIRTEPGPHGESPQRRLRRKRAERSSGCVNSRAARPVRATA